MYKQPALTKLIILVIDYDQTLDIIMFIRRLRFALITTRAISKGGQ